MKNSTKKLARHLAALFAAFAVGLSALPTAAFAAEEPENLPENSIVQVENKQDITPAEDQPVNVPDDEDQPAEDGKTTPAPTEDKDEVEPPTNPETTEPKQEEIPAEKPEEKPVYATTDDLQAAFEAVGEVLESGDIQAGIDALDEYLAIYNKLSPEDQEANTEALTAAMAYQETLKGSLEGIPDPDLETLDYTTYKTTVTFYPGDGKPTGVNMKVGDLYDGQWYVKSISVSEVTFGSFSGQHNNSITIPAPETIWKGVSHDYKTVAAYPTAFNGEKQIGASALLIYTGGHATFKNVINVPSGGGGGPYVTVVHTYYTNGVYDGEYKETQAVTAPTYSSVPKTIYTSDITSRKLTYNSNTYTYKSMSSNPATVKVAKGATGNQGTFTLRYDRTVQVAQNYTYQLTWNYNGGKVGDDSSRTKTETTQKNTHTFYEDAQGFGSPRPTKANATFAGWTYEGNGSFNSSNGQINMTGTANGTVSGTLTAVWDDIVDNGNGISITKARVSINDDTTKTTAKPGDEITWNITVTNNSNVTKTVTLTEHLQGAALSESSFTLEPGETKTVTATYTVKRSDEGTTLYNTVKATTGGTGDKENPEATDDGTEVSDPDTPKGPGTKKANYTIAKSFVGLDDDAEVPVISLTYKAYRTKDGEKVGADETGTVTLTRNSNTYTGIINPTIWDIDSGRDHISSEEQMRYKNVVEITEDLDTAAVENYTFSKFSAFYPADGTNIDVSTVKFVMDESTYEKTLFVKNSYTKNPTSDKITVTWMNGYTDTPIKTETIDKGADYQDLYPDDPTRDGYDFDGWGDPVTDDKENITITAKWKEKEPVVPDPEAPVEITKSVDKPEAEVGETVNYTVTITNKTSEQQTVTFKDILPAGLKLGGSIETSYTGSDVVGGVSGSGLEWTFTLADTVGAKMTFKYSATVQEGASGTLTNTATAAVDGKEYSDTADVTVSKDTDPDPVDPTPGGDKVTITVQFVDENGETIGDPIEVTVDKGNSYDVTDETKKIPNGYEANGDPTGDSITGTADSNKTITVPVKRTETLPVNPDPEKVTITVQFVDEDGNVVGTETKEADKDSEYNVTDETKKIPEGYEANGDPTGDPTTGTADSDKTITVPVKSTETSPVNPDPVDPPSGSDDDDDDDTTPPSGGGGYTPRPRPTPPTTDVPVIDVPAAETPETPEEEIPEPEVPLAEAPEIPESEVEVPKEDVPLADIPKTGDSGSTLWAMLLALSAAGALALMRKLRREK